MPRPDHPRIDLGPKRILFEDAHLIAIDKPPGLATQPTADPRRDHLVAAVERFLAARDGPGARPYLALHHRLDRDTSGVVVLARSRRANPGLARQFAGHRVEKTYQALAHRPAAGGELPPESWVVANRLRATKSGGKEARVRIVEEGGDQAETRFRLVEIAPRGLWVEAVPKTGRTHQIRVHLASAGLPILGDRHYGAPLEPGAPRVLLHAEGLRLAHPVTGRPLSIASPLPDDFRAALEAIRSA